jgi:hypothetical protein
VIVITTENKGRVFDCPEGTVFTMTVTDGKGKETVIKEEILVHRTIDYFVSFRFALEDGTCTGFHLCGFFGCKHNLPEEIKNAKKLLELTQSQLKTFIATCGMNITIEGS